MRTILLLSLSAIFSIIGICLGIINIKEDQSIHNFFANIASDKNEITSEKKNIPTESPQIASSTAEQQATTTPAQIENTTKSAAQIKEYTIESGDTIGAIAKKYNISVNTILWANNLKKTTILKLGQKIKILPFDGVEYAVKNGDTIKKIAALYKVEEGKISEANGLASNAELNAGQILLIPGGEK